jgi:5-methylthioadenosine/S-adenosylhomocysteine deaminase
VPKILISNATIITMNDAGDILEGADILAEDGLITGIGPAGTLESTDADIIDGRGKAVLPGFINAHTHSAMTLLRGYADDLPLTEWLETKIWPRESFLKEGDVYAGTMLAAAEMIKGGTTCFADMYFRTEEIAAAAIDSGLRADICEVFLGQTDTLDEDITRAAGTIEAWNASGGLVTGSFGPHSLYVCGAPVIGKIAAEAKRLGAKIHIHLLETEHERADIMRAQERTPFHSMRDTGMFEIPLIAAHSVYLSEREVGIATDMLFSVAHCPGSNLKLASGIAPVHDLLRRGVNVALGTDGAASNNNLDMFEEIRLAATIHKVNSRDATAVPAYAALSMATRGGAKAVGKENELGQLAPGFRADIITVDLTAPHMTPNHNVVANLVYSAGAADVVDTVVDGRVLMRDREITAFNEQEILALAAAIAADLVSRK